MFSFSERFRYVLRQLYQSCITTARSTRRSAASSGHEAVVAFVASSWDLSVSFFQIFFWVEGGTDSFQSSHGCTDLASHGVMFRSEYPADTQGVTWSPLQLAVEHLVRTHSVCQVFWRKYYSLQPLRREWDFWRLSAGSQLWRCSALQYDIKGTAKI